VLLLLVQHRNQMVA